MIEWDRVNALRNDVGAEDFGEVVEIFLEEVEEVVGRLRRGDKSALIEDLHFLRGCAMNLGFSSLSQSCEVGERVASTESPDAVDTSMIVRSYDTSHKEFVEGLRR